MTRFNDFLLLINKYYLTLFCITEITDINCNGILNKKVLDLVCFSKIIISLIIVESTFVKKPILIISLNLLFLKITERQYL